MKKDEFPEVRGYDSKNWKGKVSLENKRKEIENQKLYKEKVEK